VSTEADDRVKKMIDDYHREWAPPLHRAILVSAEALLRVLLDIRDTIAAKEVE